MPERAIDNAHLSILDAPAGASENPTEPAARSSALMIGSPGLPASKQRGKNLRPVLRRRQRQRRGEIAPLRVGHLLPAAEKIADQAAAHVGRPEVPKRQAEAARPAMTNASLGPVSDDKASALATSAIGWPAARRSRSRAEASRSSPSAFGSTRPDQASTRAFASRGGSRDSNKSRASGPTGLSCVRSCRATPRRRLGLRRKRQTQGRPGQRNASGRSSRRSAQRCAGACPECRSFVVIFLVVTAAIIIGIGVFAVFLRLALDDTVEHHARDLSCGRTGVGSTWATFRARSRPSARQRRPCRRDGTRSRDRPRARSAACR